MVTLIYESLYRAIKARLVTQDYPQGQRIPLEKLAEEHEASAWAVRIVLERLAEKGLVTKVERRGYVAPVLRTDDIEGRYHVTRHLLTIALERLRDGSGLEPSGRDSITRLLALVRECPRDDYAALAEYTCELFATIAAFTGIAPIVNAIARSNDDLYYVRSRECQAMSQVREELERFCVLLLDDDWDALIVAADEYHRRRTSFIPTLIQSASG